MKTRYFWSLGVKGLKKKKRCIKKEKFKVKKNEKKKWKKKLEINQNRKKKRLKKWKTEKKRKKLIQKPFPINILKAILSWLFTNYYFILVYHCTLEMIQSMKSYSFSIVLKQFVHRWYSAIPSLASTMLGKRTKRCTNCTNCTWWQLDSTLPERAFSSGG